MLHVKSWKLNIWNKDAITKEIIVHELIDSHQSLYSRGFHLKQSFLICMQHFSSCLRRLSNHVTYVTIISVTKFKPELQNYKARKFNRFYQRKRVKGQYFCKNSFWWHKLVIRTNFKHQIRYVICYMRNLLNFNKTLPDLTALTPMKPSFFVLFGFI